jgi:hypothetical protein
MCYLRPCRRANNPKVVGSNPNPATNRKPRCCLGFPLDRVRETHLWSAVGLYLSTPVMTMPDRNTLWEKKKMASGIASEINDAAMIRFGSVS